MLKSIISNTFDYATKKSVRIIARDMNIAYQALKKRIYRVKGRVIKALREYCFLFFPVLHGVIRMLEEQELLDWLQ